MPKRRNSKKNTKKHKQQRVVIAVFACASVLVLGFFVYQLFFNKLTICTDAFNVTKNGGTLRLPVCANTKITATNSSATKLILVVHGNGRNAADMLGYITEAAELSGAKNTIIIAPQFLTIGDVAKPEQPNTLYWDFSAWQEGGESAFAPFNRPWSISSYDATDQLIRQTITKAKYPNLQEVVIVGHSGGGQFVNRYAAGNATEQILNSANIKVRYVVASPSSYMYFDPLRKTDSGNFAIPKNPPCFWFNTYKYGSDNLNPYMAQVGINTIREQYKQRTITYLLGEKDTNPKDKSLDTSCAANMQGSQRLERGTNYYDYLGVYFGARIYQNQNKVIVKNVKHDTKKIYISPTGRNAIFN